MLLRTALQIAREEVQLHRGHLVEARVALVVRMHKVFDLRHLELAHAQQTRARRNLVAERQTNLATAEYKTQKKKKDEKNGNTRQAKIEIRET